MHQSVEEVLTKFMLGEGGKKVLPVPDWVKSFRTELFSVFVLGTDH